MLHRLLHVPLLAILCSSICLTAAAQDSQKLGTVAITVIDPSGGPIPHARVELAPSPDRTPKPLETDQDGKLSISVAAGDYDIAISSPGFRTSTQHLKVNSSANQMVSVALSIAPSGSPMVESSPADQSMSQHVLEERISTQQSNEPHRNGVIYGIVIGQDGQRAEGIGLTAYPLGVVLAAVLPHTRTNDAGEYKFEKIPWGRYKVFANDEDAGYSHFSTGTGRSEPSEVELTPEHPEAELKVYLPPRAGFVEIHLTNQKTGAPISAMRVALMSTEKPTSPLFTESCYSNKIILIPPDKPVLLHISSDGFHEWNESIAKGKLIRLASGDHLKLDVQLDPLQ